MATRCSIAVEVEDDIYVEMYVHSDGYHSYTGKILQLYYSRYDLATLLVACGAGGGMSMIRFPLDIQAVDEDSNVYTDVSSVRKGYSSFSYFESSLEDGWEEHIYLFTKNAKEWKVYDLYGDEAGTWRLLSEVDLETNAPPMADDIEKNSEFESNPDGVSEALKGLLDRLSFPHFPEYEVSYPEEDQNWSF